MYHELNYNMMSDEMILRKLNTGISAAFSNKELSENRTNLQVKLPLKSKNPTHHEQGIFLLVSSFKKLVPRFNVITRCTFRARFNFYCKK